jgi:hypothetical protein
MRKHALTTPTAANVAGVHDGIGAVVKRTLRLAKDSGHRLPTSRTAADYLKEHLRSTTDVQRSFKSAYSIDRFEVLFVPRGDVVRESTALTGIKGTRSYYQFIGVSVAEQGRSRRVREQQAQSQADAPSQKPGKKAAPHLEHKLLARAASCYCSCCRAGRYQDCMLAQRGGVGGLVGQPVNVFVKEALPAGGGGGGGSEAAPAAKGVKRKRPATSSATAPMR